MRWAESLISWKNSKALQMIWFLLRVVRASFPASRARFVQTLSNDAFTIVFWPDRLDIPSPHPDIALTSTGWRLTWWFRQWKRWRMWATPGNNGVVVGTEQTPSTSSYQEPVNMPASKDGSSNSSHNPLQVGGKRS